MSPSLPSAASTVTGTSHRLPFAFPSGRPRIALLVIRGIVFAAIAGLVWVVATEPGEWPLGITTTATLSDGLVAAGIGWLVVCTLVLVDGRRVFADGQVVRIRTQLRTRILPWASIARISSTGPGLRFTHVDGASETFDLVDRSVKTRLVVQTSPMVAVAAQLDAIRAALQAGGELDAELRPSTRFLALSVEEWAQIGGMLVLLVGVVVFAG